MHYTNRIPGWFDYGGLLIVPVKLNGTRLYFMVDSGATYCSINQKLLDKIIAEPTDIKLSIAPIGKERLSVATLRIDTFAVGGTIQKNMLVSIVDFPEGFQLDGILGMNFMGKYRITIETDTATLILREIKKKK